MVANEEDLHQLFDTYDQDKSGFLSKEEYVRWVFGGDAGMAHVTSQSIIADMDKDGDGHLDLSDLQHKENEEHLTDISIHTEL